MFFDDAPALERGAVGCLASSPPKQKFLAFSNTVVNLRPGAWALETVKSLHRVMGQPKAREPLRKKTSLTQPALHKP